jgi:hypothetical protein
MEKLGSSGSNKEEEAAADDGRKWDALKAFLRGRRSVSVYDLPGLLLEPFFTKAKPPANDQVFGGNRAYSGGASLPMAGSSAPGALQKGLTCRACGKVFTNREEQLVHYGSREHLLKLKCLLSQEGADSEGEDGSSDSEDSASDDEIDQEDVAECGLSLAVHAGALSCALGKVIASSCPRRRQRLLTLAPPRAPFHLSMSYSSLPPPDEGAGHLQAASAAVLWKQAATFISSVESGNRLSAVLLLRNGRFAGAVFDGSAVIAHKHLHRYTVRAKRGGGQSSYDSAGRKAKSAGAMLRRHGEMALKDDVQQLLKQWSGFLKACAFIVISAPPTMKQVIFGFPDSPLEKNDPRIRKCPIQFRRPTFADAREVHLASTTLYFDPPLESSIFLEKLNVKEKDSGQGKQTAPSPPAPTANHSSHSGNIAIRPLAEIDALGKSVLDACESGSLADVQSALTSCSLAGLSYDPVNVAHPETLCTPLHLAAAKGNALLIEYLFDSGADPMRLDVRGRTPYFLASTKVARDAFRRSRGRMEERWDWDAAKVPTGLRTEDLDAAREKEKEKRRRAKERKKENKLKAKVQAEEAETAERRLKAEEESRAKAEGSCSVCSCPLPAKGKAICINDKKVCGSDCVRALRRALAAQAAERRISS